jgi:hypothetical protein
VQSRWPPFEETMQRLDELTRRSRERQTANLHRLATMTRALDDPLFSEPSPQLETTPAKPSHLTPTQTRWAEEDADDLRAGLPARTTHGGPYGDSILQRVARSYGAVD